MNVAFKDLLYCCIARKVKHCLACELWTHETRQALVQDIVKSVPSTPALKKYGEVCFVKGLGGIILCFSDWDFSLQINNFSLWVRVVHDRQLWLFTILVSDVGAGSAPEQLQGTLLLASISCRVQRSVSQQICAVDVWRLFPAELQQMQRKQTDGLCGPKCSSLIFC